MWHREKSHLHLSTAGAHSQVVALFDPRHRRYIVPRLLHLQQLQDVTRASTPQVHTVVQCHSQYIPRAPIHQVQVCQRSKGKNLSFLSAWSTGPFSPPTQQEADCTYSSHYGFQGRPRYGLEGKECNGRSSGWSQEWPSDYRVLSIYSGNLWQQS